MMLWILLGLYMLARKDGRIVTVMGAGLCFGLALVTKENALFILPGCAYLLHRAIKGQPNRRFGVSFWWFAALAPVVGYLLFAQIKNELFPQNFNFSLAAAARGDHVSLLYTVWWQLQPQLQQQQRPVVHHVAAGQLAVQGPLPAHRRQCRGGARPVRRPTQQAAARAGCWPAR